MDETTIGIIGVVIALGLLVAVAYFLQNRSRTHGNLFTGKPSLTGRIIAIVIGLPLVGISAYEFLTQPLFHPVLGIVGIACLLYGVGINSFMKVIQGEKSTKDTIDTKQE
jgi:hypothetical protein